ncbi:MAG: hypothetical protein RLZZ519_2932 [Bacteroidota bacterium]|jgi:hypothetical protein
MIMKKMSKVRNLFLLFLVMLGAGSATAQIQKGSFFVETDFGNVGISSNNGRSAANDSVYSFTRSRYFGFGLYPRAGYLLTDNLAVGAEVDFYFNTSSSDYLNVDEVKTSTSKSNNISIGLGPFVRYYFARSSNGKSAFYGQATVGLNAELMSKYGSESYDTDGVVTSTFDYDYSKPYKYLYGSAQVGWNRMLADNVALNLALGFRYMQTTQTYSYTYTYPNGTSNTSDIYHYRNSSLNLTWSGGITMFIPTK